jgi:hypothetical protein
VRAGCLMRAGRNLLLLISTLVPCNSTSALGQPPGPFDPELFNDVGLMAQAR